MAAEACHQDLPYRPDFKLIGSYPLPLDILIQRHCIQFIRGVQTGGAAPSVLATWATTPACSRRRSAAHTRRVRPPRAST